MWSYASDSMLSSAEISQKDTAHYVSHCLVFPLITPIVVPYIIPYIAPLKEFRVWLMCKPSYLQAASTWVVADLGYPINIEKVYKQIRV